MGSGEEVTISKGPGMVRETSYPKAVKYGVKATISKAGKMVREIP